MPNWVTNKIRVGADPDQMNKILNAIKYDDGQLGSFDFNKLIPQPESLDVTDGGITEAAIIAFLSHLRSEAENHPDRPVDFEEIKRYVDAGKKVFAKSFLPKEPKPMSEKDIETEAEWAMVEEVVGAFSDEMNDYEEETDGQ